MATYTNKPGLGLVAAYQVSGKPYVTGALDCQSFHPAGQYGSPRVVHFPYVTSWVTVVNNGATDCRVGFAEDGVTGTNYFTVKSETANGGISRIGPLDLKVTQLWLSGSTDVDVVAGLTYVENIQIDNASVSPAGANWSGSIGALVG